MKIILQIDDKKLGKKNSVIEVADSYARNVLIPKGIAVAATADNVNKLQAKLDKEKREYDAKLESARDVTNALTAIPIPFTISARGSDDGRLFGAITTKTIAEELKKQKGIEVDKKEIELTMSMKIFGTYSVNFKLFGGVVANIIVNVIRED